MPFFYLFYKLHVHSLGHTKSDKKNIDRLQNKWHGILRADVETYVLLCPQGALDVKQTKKVDRILKFIELMRISFN